MEPLEIKIDVDQMDKVVELVRWFNSTPKWFGLPYSVIDDVQWELGNLLPFFPDVYPELDDYYWTVYSFAETSGGLLVTLSHSDNIPDTKVVKLLPSSGS